MKADDPVLQNPDLVPHQSERLYFCRYGIKAEYETAFVRLFLSPSEWDNVEDGFSVEQAHRHYEYCSRVHRDRGEYWHVIEKDSLRLVGDLHYARSPGDRRATLGACMDRQFAGQGYGLEAGRAVLEWLFVKDPTPYPTNRVEAGCSKKNTALIHLFETLGMTYEGTMLDYKRIRGQFHDAVNYRILRREYLEKFGSPGPQ